MTVSSTANLVGHADALKVKLLQVVLYCSLATKQLHKALTVL